VQVGTRGEVRGEGQVQGGGGIGEAERVASRANPGTGTCESSLYE
jgi:hypothetical protein